MHRFKNETSLPSADLRRPPREIILATPLICALMKSLLNHCYKFLSIARSSWKWIPYGLRKHLCAHWDKKLLNVLEFSSKNWHKNFRIKHFKIFEDIRKQRKILTSFAHTSVSTPRIEHLLNIFSIDWAIWTNY